MSETGSLRSMMVWEGDSILRAFKAIDRGGSKICLVYGPDDRLVGVLSDGDLRRALLAGAALDSDVSSYVVRTPVVVAPDESRDAVVDLMRSRSISALPVVDKVGMVVGLHTLNEMLSVAPRRNLAVVMAGGRGTRLGSLTASTPKPMLKVAGRPILERIVLQLVGEGFRRVALSVNYLSHVIEDYFGDGTNHGCEISYLRERPENPLGTAGSLSLVEGEADPIVVTNGDLISEVPFGQLVESHESRSNDLTVALAEHTHQVPFGVVSTDGDQIYRLDEKPVVRWQVNAGVYAVSPEMVDLVPKEQFFNMTDLADKVMGANLRFGAYRIPGAWVDIGRPSELEAARGEVK